MKVLGPFAGIGSVAMGVAILFVDAGVPWVWGAVFVLLGPVIAWNFHRVKEVVERDDCFLVRGWIRDESIPCSSLTGYKPLPSPHQMIGSLYFGRRKVDFIVPTDRKGIEDRLNAHLARNGARSAGQHCA